MDTASLRLFVLAAEKLNISAAGRELGLAPAVAGAHLAKLENAVGADLLHRTTRKVSLSLEGAEFLPFAREILAQEDAARAALGKGHATPRGTLRFTAPSTFAQLYIAPILPEFLRRYPDLTLDLRLSDSVFDLIEGSFDLAIRNSALEDSSLKGRKLADDVRMLCASPGYLRDNGVPAHPSDLVKHQLIAFKNQSARPLIGPGGERAVFAPAAAKNRLILDDGLTQKLATIAGAGISINSRWSVDKELASGQLVQVLPDYAVADKSVLWLVYPNSNVLSPKVRVFMDFLVEKIVRNRPWAGG
ncbi:LysR substrate-binding domain-containing protein [Marinovum sp. 2_MG-2023]|uniref:LysR family transcriptional regulator n=1 Tax=unclassified Marinovum TaxID=2647166 RepID=UPI0026E1DE41|nr:MULTISPECIES: LysR family transcriptional regulator [unclassified Marinovum]MDO6731461.1 LysR substrate-binding domain-containing protein [Marinovum sp. 2_MG-2023]MDO6780821.1 LysR substrate-binding domain-containing protein [Marinovum sp. 1_MG-2023]